MFINLKRKRALLESKPASNKVDAITIKEELINGQLLLFFIG